MYFYILWNHFELYSANLLVTVISDTKNLETHKWEDLSYLHAK